MAGINKYYNRIPYQGELYQPNVELISSVLDQAQKKYDTNFAISEKIKNRYVNALPQDRAAADQIQGETEKKIDDIVGKYSGDYSAASKDLYRLLGDIEKEYNPGGKAHAIETNYNTYNTQLAGERERLKKGEVLSAQVAALQGHVQRTYQGIGEKDSVTGSYNMLNVPDLAKYVDESKLIDEAYAKTPEQKRKEGKTYFKDGNQYYSEVETQGKPYEVLQQSFSDALVSDNAYINYKDQLNYLTGSQADIGQDIMNTADAYASTRAYMNTSDILKAERDPVYLENLRHGHRMSEAKYKQKLKDDSTGEVMQNLFGSLNIGENVNRMAGSELGANWRTKPSSYSAPAYNAATGQLYPGSDPFTERLVGQSYKENLYDLMNSGKLKEIAPGVNGNLLQAGARKLAAEQGFKLEDQSEAWKRNFFSANEGEIRDQYNTDRKNVQAGIADEITLSDDASKVLKEQLIPRAMSGATSVSRIENGKLSEYSKLGDIGIKQSDLYDDNGAIKKGVKITDYVIPGQFYDKPAYKAILPDGRSFFITDQNKDRYEHFTEIAQGHDPIWKEGKEWGSSFTMQHGDENIRVVPRMVYEYDQSGTAHQNLQYYHVTPDGKMDLVTNAKETAPASIYDIWNLDSPRVQSALPLGATKKSKTKFILDYLYNDDNEE